MQLIKSKLLNDFTNLTHAFTTKDGGVSRGNYKSLNMAFHVKDKIQDVNNNHKILASCLNYDKKVLVHMKQIHSCIVHIVNDIDTFENPPTCDALITDRVNTPLMVMVADCSPILFYDTSHKVIAVAHAGRAGAFKNIVKNVIDTFTKEYDSDSKNIIVSIGASIGSCCYKVGSEIYNEAKKLNLEYAFDKIDDNYYLDIRAILKKQLLNSNIKEQNIDISDECSCCKNDKYFSYRKDDLTGRFCGIIVINNII